MSRDSSRPRGAFKDFASLTLGLLSRLTLRMPLTLVSLVAAPSPVHGRGLGAVAALELLYSVTDHMHITI